MPTAAEYQQVSWGDRRDHERVSTLAGALRVSDEGDGTVLPSSLEATLVALWGPWSYDHGPSGSDPFALPR